MVQGVQVLLKFSDGDLMWAAENWEGEGVRHVLGWGWDEGVFHGSEGVAGC